MLSPAPVANRKGPRDADTNRACWRGDALQALATAPARLREDRLLVLAAVQVGVQRVWGLSRVYGLGVK